MDDLEREIERNNKMPTKAIVSGYTRRERKRLTTDLPSDVLDVIAMFATVPKKWLSERIGNAEGGSFFVHDFTAPITALKLNFAHSNGMHFLIHGTKTAADDEIKAVIIGSQGSAEAAVTKEFDGHVHACRVTYGGIWAQSKQSILRQQL